MSEIDDLISLLKNNWTAALVPTVTKMTSMKRSDFRDSSYIHIYEYNYDEKKRGSHYDFVKKTMTFSFDIRTKNGYQDLRIIDAEVLRILHANRKDPITGYDKLEIIRRTDLSEKAVRLYHIVIDVSIIKLFSAL